ncbi:MAG: O-antigen ligase family protein [Clostridia bacterium]|nr:O-antigen ligase family protein [Clostridia bacterium]
MWLCFAAGALFISFGAEVAGVVFFVLLISLILTVSDDILPTTFPFLVICISVLQCYNSFDTFIKLWWLAFPVVAAVVFHFVFYRRPIVIGRTFYGIVAVTVAVSIGGFGFISIENYLKSMYYVAGLGVGMMICYILIKSQLEIERDYDWHEKFVDIMYMAGLFTCFQLIAVYVENYISLSDRLTLLEFLEKREIIGEQKLGMTEYYPSTIAPNTIMLQCGNNISTFLMLFMPFPFYKAMQSNRKLWHLVTPFFMMGIIFLSGSRGGLLMGGVEFFICLIAFSVMTRNKLSRWVGWGISAVALCAATFVAFEFGLITKLVSMVMHAEDEVRGKLFSLSIREFIESPIFGKGIANPAVNQFYSGKTGTMGWYHMMIPQVIGSMGIVGIAGYGYQIFTRVREVIRRFNPFVMILGLSYLGVFLMTQVNPGEFCPLPYEMMVVMLFAIIEKEPERVKIKN